jgi:hypothetical protein
MSKDESVPGTLNGGYHGSSYGRKTLALIDLVPIHYSSRSRFSWVPENLSGGVAERTGPARGPKAKLHF